MRALARLGAPKTTKQPNIVAAPRRKSMRPYIMPTPVAAIAIIAIDTATAPVIIASNHATEATRALG